MSVDCNTIRRNESGHLKDNTRQVTFPRDPVVVGHAAP